MSVTFTRNTQTNKCRQAGRESGYTLLSAAMSLLVVGLLAAAGLSAYNVYLANQKIALNNVRVNTAVNKIQEFRQTFNRYPCPSSLTAGRNDAAYGSDIELNCSSGAIAIGSCSNGACVVSSDPTRVAISPRVRIGALPFRALQMQEKEAYDAYGSRLYYAVTETQAVATTFNETSGGINIIDENGNSVLNPQGSGNFIVISSGPNRIGAYSIEGGKSLACPLLTDPGASIEASNCVDIATPAVILGEAASPTVSAQFRSSFAALAGGANNFDDTVDYFSSLQDPTWKRTVANSNNIEALINSGVGVGVNNPGTGLPATNVVDVGMNVGTGGTGGIGGTWTGAVRVSSAIPTASMQANILCDKNGANCFDPASITGNNTTGEGMKCANPGEYMIGIESGQAKCAPVRIFCPNPAKPVMNGLIGGVPNCVAAKINCLAGSVQLCDSSGAFSPRHSNQVQTNATGIGADIDGAIKDLFDVTPATFAANPKKARFTCNNGVWLYTSDLGGFCGSTCTPPAWAGPAPYTGTTTTHGTASCAGAMGGVTVNTTTVSSFNMSNCTISGSTTNDTPCNCAGYFPVVGGNPTTGPSGNPPPTKPADIIGTCSNPPFNTGSTTQPYVWNSSDGVCNWEKSSTASTCACNPALAGAPPAAGSVMCNSLSGPAPAGANSSGNAIEQWTFNSATSGAKPCQYVMSGYDVSGCSCDPTTEHASTGSFAATCNTTCDNQATAPVWVFKYSGGGCTKGPDYIKTAATASAKPFKWTSQGIIGPISASGKSSMPECNTTCRTSPVGACLPAGTTNPFTSPAVTPGGAACPEKNSSGSCWSTSGSVYYSNIAKCM